MLGLLLLLLSLYFYFFNEKRYLSVFLLFALCTAAFQMVPISLMILPSAGITKTYDWVLVFAGIMLVLKPRLFFQVAVWQQYKALMVYGLLVTALLFYSIFFIEVEVPVSLRVYRSLMFLITLFLFVPLTLPDYVKVFKLIVYTTSLASFIYCLQLLVHVSLLNMVIDDATDLTDTLVTRYYNVPVFVYPVLFFLFFGKKEFSIHFRWLLLAVNAMAIVFSQHRNLLLAVLICFVLHLVVANKLRFRMAFACTLLGIALLLSGNYFWGERFSEGFNDLSKTSATASAVNFNEVTLSDLTTTEFRQLMLRERLAFILKDDVKTLFGIGFITDDSNKAKALNFNVGSQDDYGNVAQVASSDIAWSPLLLQLGLAGTLAFIWAYLSLLVKFFKQRHNVFMQVGCLYIISLYITSFYSNTIALPYTTTLLMLFAAYYYHLTKNIA